MRLPVRTRAHAHAHAHARARAHTYTHTNARKHTRAIIRTRTPARADTHTHAFSNTYTRTCEHNRKYPPHTLAHAIRARWRQTHTNPPAARPHAHARLHMHPDPHEPAPPSPFAGARSSVTYLIVGLTREPHRQRGAGAWVLFLPRLLSGLSLCHAGTTLQGQPAHPTFTNVSFCVLNKSAIV